MGPHSILVGSEKGFHTPRHKTNTCRKQFLGNSFFREYMRGLYSHSRENRKYFLRSHFLHICQIFEGNLFRGVYMSRLYSHPRGCSGRKKAHKHKLFALVNVQMALGQTAGCPKVNRAKKFMCSPRNTGNINFSVFASKHRKYNFFPLVNRRVVPGLSRLSKSLCVQMLCTFFLP